MRAAIKPILFFLVISGSSPGQEVQTKPDSSPHTGSFVAVDKAVKLEVLDWGGSGRPVVLLAGLGSTATRIR